jgi:nucleolar complex protein 3
VDDLPSIDSGDEGEASWSSNLETDADSESDVATTSSLDDTRKMPDGFDSDTEMPYEAVPRRRRPSWDHGQNDTIPHLPIKLRDGRVQKVEDGGTTPSSQVKNVLDEDEGVESDTSGRNEPATVEDISTGARFGRPAVIDVIRNSSRKARVQGSREEIALICQSIVAEPESSVGAFVC